jgi:hypothetical protein
MSGSKLKRKTSGLIVAPKEATKVQKKAAKASEKSAKKGGKR